MKKSSLSDKIISTKAESLQDHLRSRTFKTIDREVMPMKKDRVAAFTDAVLAIIMTILVLELEKPSEPTLAALWELRYSFFSYTLSFFWLGSMWVNIHNEWETIEKINAKTLWVTLVLLFFCSVIPYATDFVSRDFNSKVAQGFYGVFVMLVTFQIYGSVRYLNTARSAVKKCRSA